MAEMTARSGETGKWQQHTTVPKIRIGQKEQDFQEYVPDVVAAAGMAG